MSETTEPQSITKAKVKKIIYPLDKVNSNIWNALHYADKNGQFQLNLDVTADKDRENGKQALIYYAIFFEDLENVRFSKELTALDKRVYVAISAIYKAGNAVTSYSQIFSAMGYDGKPKADTIQQIANSVHKMSTARITVNNEREVAVYKRKKTELIEDYLLPCKIQEAYINGKLTKSAVYLLYEPPLMTFARNRKQVTTFDKLLLHSPLSKTDANIQLEDYLIERIAPMKSGRAAQNIIDFATLCEKVNIRTPMQRQRLPQKLSELLNFYWNCGYIKGFELGAESLKIDV